jgi:large subunit ribosomal protein L5
MKQRIEKFYQEQVVMNICKQFSYNNVHKIPRLQKIAINRGLGSSALNIVKVEFFLLEIAKITRQRGTITRTRTAIAGFKIRKKIPMGLIITLRCKHMYAFIDRLIHLALPRIRDFYGLRPNSFDGNGNYSFGFAEQLIFPEVCYDHVDKLVGIDISIVTTVSSVNERFALLRALGIPFQNRT